MKDETIKSDIEETNKSSLGETLARIEKYILIGTKNVLNIDEASIVLGVTIRALRKMVAEHTIPIYKPNQRAFRFSFFSLCALCSGDSLSAGFSILYISA